MRKIILSSVIISLITVSFLGCGSGKDITPSFGKQNNNNSEYNLHIDKYKEEIDLSSYLFSDEEKQNILNEVVLLKTYADSSAIVWNKRMTFPNDNGCVYPLRYDLIQSCFKIKNNILQREDEFLNPVNMNKRIFKGHLEFVNNFQEELKEKYQKRLKYLDKLSRSQDEATQLAAIQNYSKHIKYINNPTEKVQLLAIEKDIKNIKHIKNISENTLISAIEIDSKVIKHLKITDPKLQLICVQNNGYNIQYIKNPSEEIQIAAIEYDVKTISSINNPTVKVLQLVEKSQIESIKMNPLNIENINNPSENLQLVAVKANPRAIHHIKNPSHNVLKYVAEKAPKFLGYSNMNFSEYNEEIQLIAIAGQPSLFRWVNNPSENFQLTAVKNNSEVMQYIRNPTLKVQLAAYGEVKTNLERPAYESSNKHLTVKVVGGKLKVSNRSQKFLKIKSMAEYFGENVNSLNSFNIPPETVITKTLFNSRKNTINSLNQSLQYGFAIEYQMANENKVYDFYKTKKYKVGNLLK